MTSHNTKIWEAKLAARIHDPAEKAFVLLNDPSGHEGGTVRELKKQLFPEGFSHGIQTLVKKSDWWASAADRPQFPQDAKNRYAKWTQVDFASKGELIHPLSGERFDLRGLGVDWKDAKAENLLHFQKLIYKNSEGAVDWKKTTLAFWRFGQDLGVKELQMLWELLPADTRVPDHTIWAHLDLCSAFAGAMAGDAKKTPALLTVSLGPVQSFIAQARSTSDLWAGSHLLSRLAWEGLKVICEELGPDAVIFPQLRSIPCVDLWIEEQLGKWPKEAQTPDWKKGNTDSNPLFSAALPNRFMAIVPESQAESLAKTIESQVRIWVKEQAYNMLQKLLEKVPMSEEEQNFAQTQIDRQFAGFPEVTWSAVPWSLVQKTENNKLDTEALESASSPFFPKKQHGFLGSKAWEILSQKEGIEIDGCKFYNPNEGVLYPALYELLERSNASAKSLRPFEQQQEQGYRCSLCGEREWISSSESHLFLPPGKQASKPTLWTQVSKKQISWARKGEHLCGICALKRLWPTLFMEDIKKSVPTLGGMSRYVISTHTMALAPTLERWLKQGTAQTPSKLMLDQEDSAALPVKLARQLQGKSEEVQNFVKKMPAFLDRLHAEKGADAELEVIQREIKKTLGSLPETYYAFIKLDGDKMGAWLSGSETKYQLSYEESWHSQIREKAKAKLKDSGASYLEEKRWASPARHAAISASLNSFALHLTRHVIENLHKGKLLYAGGDDVMAMVSIDDLLSAMLMLRLLYSGSLPHDDSELLNIFSETPDLEFRRGFVLWKKKLYRMMGHKATASAGAVIAHYSTPLALVKRELDQCESEAKNKGDRDAFSLRVLKRAGGQVSITSKWFDSHKESSLHPMILLMKMSRILGSKHLSRRAAYHVQDWLRQLPNPEGVNAKGEKQEGMEPKAYERMLIANIRRQFKQQGGNETDQQEAENLARIAIQYGGCEVSQWLEGFLGVAEFLGRREFEQTEE